jgi:predicted DNA-binding transcriptional regulator AlpA
MKYITKDEVAGLLRVSVRTISAYMSQGLLPQPLQLGRRLLWDESALTEFIQQPVVKQPVARRRGRPRKLSM